MKLEFVPFVGLVVVVGKEVGVASFAFDVKSKSNGFYRCFNRKFALLIGYPNAY